MATKKKPAKKTAAKKISSKKKDTDNKTVTAKPSTDSTGVVVMRSVDDPGETTEGQAITVRPVFDKETGSIIMTPVENKE